MNAAEPGVPHPALGDSLATLRQTQDELGQSERLAAIGQLTATVSHELRNPLGTLMTSVSVLSRSLADTEPPVRAELERIQRNVWRCVRIIEDLLEFSRKREPALRPVAVDSWLAQQLEEIEAPEGVTVHCDLSSDAELQIDGEKLQQAFGNILQNAFQAVSARAEENGETQKVEVRSRLRDGRLAISVGDSGPGMSAEVQRRIFEPLYSTKAFGVGLGMPLVKRIAEQHGGSVEVDSREGLGTTVTVMLPLSAEGRGAQSAAAEQLGSVAAKVQAE